MLDSPRPAEVVAPLTRPTAAIEAAGPITIDEMRSLQAKGEPMVIVDARSNAGYDGDSIKAAGAVRLSPDDPVRDATQQRLSQRSTLVVYCA